MIKYIVRNPPTKEQLETLQVSQHLTNTYRSFRLEHLDIGTPLYAFIDSLSDGDKVCVVDDNNNLYVIVDDLLVTTFKMSRKRRACIEKQLMWLKIENKYKEV